MRNGYEQKMRESGKVFWYYFNLKPYSILSNYIPPLKNEDKEKWYFYAHNLRTQKFYKI
jgi:hypothetical protein